jgi:membrane protein DedA with SNARE-associated domain
MLSPKEIYKVGYNRYWSKVKGNLYWAVAASIAWCSLWVGSAYALGLVNKPTGLSEGDISFPFLVVTLTPMVVVFVYLLVYTKRARKAGHKFFADVDKE